MAGAGRSAERREGCEGLQVGEGVVLEREPDNRHDANAILILNSAGDELGAASPRVVPTVQNSTAPRYAGT